MALFGRESDERSAPMPSPAPARQPSTRGNQKTTLIASGATLVGEISGDTDVMIEGTVEGKIHPSQDVSVGEQGIVRGEIQARRVRVAGKVQGNVRGRESVEILATGSLEGDVASPGMVIGDGAFFKGRVEMTGNQPQPKPDEPKARRDEPKQEAKPEAPATATGAALSPGEAGA